MSEIKFPEKCRHVFVSHNCNWWYNRSWGFNVGYKHSVGESLVFADNDVFMPMKDLTFVLEESQKYDATNPYSKIIYANPIESKTIIETGMTNEVVGKIRTALDFAGGMVIFKRSAFEEVGGWDERFYGWGGEDTAMTYKINKILEKDRCVKMEFNAFHLFHPPNYTIKKRWNISNKKRLLWWYFAQSKESLLEYLKAIDINDIGCTQFKCGK